MEDLRVKALEAAQRENLQGAALLKRAEEIYQWLRYGNDGATEMRKAISGEPIETPKATIYREPPFKDYKRED